LGKYVSEFLKQWVNVVFLVIEGAAFACEALLGLPVPRETYWIVAAIGVLVAGFRVYLKQERTIESLARELQEVRERIPDIRLGFMEEDGLVTELEISVPPYPEPPDIDDLTKQEEEGLAHKPRRHPPKHVSIGNISIPLWSQPTETQLQEYAEEVADYLTEYREYLQSKHAYDIFWCKAYPTKLVIENTGNCPITDVIVVLHVPEQFLVLEHSDLPTEPEPPTKPRLRTRLDVPEIPIPYLGDYLTRPYSSDIDLVAGDDDVSGPFIEPEESPKVSYKLPKLMHNIPRKDFDPFYIVVPGERVSRNFDIPYEIHANELPYPSKGQLKLEVRYAIDGEQV